MGSLVSITVTPHKEEFICDEQEQCEWEERNRNCWDGAEMQSTVLFGQVSVVAFG